ncbi:uncharacterized protein LOC121864697 [Homarus americanus]|uniref:uncharacterized protein LOC121864697 n=1 Tax=Homarus americanus TaxID=6706 RepID=UPI001C44AD81|nr:uncharacterized protein LOC121864697 [Homarus americanus]
MMIFIVLVLPSSGLPSSSILSYVFLSCVLLLPGILGAGHPIDSSRFMIPPSRRSHGFPYKSVGDSDVRQGATYNYMFARKPPQHPLSLTPTTYSPDAPKPKAPTPTTLTSPYKRLRHTNSSLRTAGEVRIIRQERHRKSRVRGELFLPEASLNLSRYSRFAVYSEYSEVPAVLDSSSVRSHSLKSVSGPDKPSVTSIRDASESPLWGDRSADSNSRLGKVVTTERTGSDLASPEEHPTKSRGSEVQLNKENSEKYLSEPNRNIRGLDSDGREHLTPQLRSGEEVNFDLLNQKNLHDSEITVAIRHGIVNSLKRNNVRVAESSDKQSERTVDNGDFISSVGRTHKHIDKKAKGEVNSDVTRKSKSHNSFSETRDDKVDSEVLMNTVLTRVPEEDSSSGESQDTHKPPHVRGKEHDRRSINGPPETRKVMSVSGNSYERERERGENEEVITYMDREEEISKKKMTRETKTEENNEHQNEKRFVNAIVAGTIENSTTLQLPIWVSTYLPNSGFRDFHVSPFNPDQGFDSLEQANVDPLRRYQAGANPTVHTGEVGIDITNWLEGQVVSPPLVQSMTDADATLLDTRGELHTRRRSPTPTTDVRKNEGEAVEEENNNGINDEERRSIPTWEKATPVDEHTEIIVENLEADSHMDINKEQIVSNDAQLTRHNRLHYIYKKNKIERTADLLKIKTQKDDNNMNNARRGESQEPATDVQNIPPEHHPMILHEEPHEGAVEDPGSKHSKGTIPSVNRSTNRRKSQASSVPLLDTEGSVRIPCYVIIFLLGVIGNTLVIVTLLQNRKMRTITNVFLLNLAFSDLLLGVFCMPFTLVGSLLRDFIFGPVMCRLIPYFQAVSVSVSVWTLVAISLERYYAICQPLRSRGWQTLSHAYKIISLVWLLSLVFMAPIAALSQLLPVGDTSRHKCREMWPSLHLERGFSMFLGAGLLLVPLVIMVAAYSSITISLWHGMRLERETGQGTRPLISLTDLNGLAMVQQSLRRKHSRRVSKISIRFRKIPAQTRTCEHCCQPESVAIPEVVVHSHKSPTDLTHTPSSSQDGTHVCLHGRDCQNYKWHVESVRENGNLESPHRKEPKTGFKRLRSTHLEKSIEAKKHVIKMLFVVVLEFFLCWTPIFVVNIMCLYIPEQVYRVLGSFGISFMHLLSYASSCCNPITYCFMNKKFLQGFRHAFGCRKENERMGRLNGTAASFRSQSNNAFKLAMEIKKDTRETTV